MVQQTDINPPTVSGDTLTFLQFSVYPMYSLMDQQHLEFGKKPHTV